MRLDRKIALVTGAARGIGAATARRFAEEGARVAVADRRVDEGEALVAELNRQHGGQHLRQHDGQHDGQGNGPAIFVALDVTQEDAWGAAIEAVTATWGGLDVLVNNAGMIRVAPLEKTDLALFEKVIGTNLVGAFLGIKAAMAPMKARGGGSIVNFSSVQGLEGREGMSAYAASKFGVRGLSKTAAIELGPSGIRVNVVVPGPTRTRMTEREGWTDAQYDEAYGGYPLGRMARATEIADVVVFLASDEASFCTGADYVVDGGVLAGKPRT